TQWAESFLYKHEDLSLGFQHPHKNWALPWVSTISELGDGEGCLGLGGQPSFGFVKTACLKTNKQRNKNNNKK
ncbi:hypothetical protein ACQP3C_29050, partial [Escherichia coli]